MNWFLLLGVLACAGYVQGLSGFGFGMVSMSLMPLFMSVKQAAFISTAFTLLATVATFTRHFREYKWQFGFDFIVSVCVGVPLGAYFLEKSSETVLIRFLGGLMLAYALREFLIRRQPESFPRAWTIPLGLFSGVMSGAFNLGGVPSAAYAYAQPWSRGQIMGFLQVMITISCLIRLVFYQQAGLSIGLTWWQACLLAIPLYGVIRLGHLSLQRIDARWMRKGIFVFIGVSGFFHLFLHPFHS